MINPAPSIERGFEESKLQAWFDLNFYHPANIQHSICLLDVIVIILGVLSST
jgi:hypothetical protein